MSPAGPKPPNFSGELKERGASRVVCGRRDRLGLATSTPRRPLRSRQPLGQASFLPGRVGKGVISGNLQKKFRAPFRGRLTGGRLGREGGREEGRKGGWEEGREGGREGEREHL